MTICDFEINEKINAIFIITSDAQVTLMNLSLDILQKVQVNFFSMNNVKIVLQSH